MAPLFPEIVDCEINDEPTEAVESERRTILGMPPLVPPRKDTVKMLPLERAAMLAPPRATGRTPVAIIDEDATRITLPWRPRLRAWLAWLWRRISAPAARRAPQAR
jgi:hypothetical protein